MTEVRQQYPDGAVAAQIRREPAAGQVTVGFVHGLGATSAVWQPLLAHLPQEWGITTFGLPWDAASGNQWAVRERPETWLERALQLPQRPPQVLVAHSFGANAALQLLSTTGGAWASTPLVLMSPFHRATPETVDWAVLSHYLNGFEGLLRDGLLARPGSGPNPDLVDAMAERLRDRISPYGWLRFVTLFATTPLLDLHGLTMPCLVISGAADTAAYPADGAALAGRLPRARSATVPGGHFMMVDAPVRTANLLTEFISGVVEPMSSHPDRQPR
jgi:pimeloyl-ACP methyl ester carboxylesterase